jgi:predicted transcriptional regulator
MPVTSLKLPRELKQRIQQLVKDGERSAHAFMIEAIERATLAEELRQKFGADAADAETQMMASGKGFHAREAFATFEARLSGKTVQRPRAKAWRASS